MKSAKVEYTKWSEVVKEVNGWRQKEQRGADVLSLTVTIMALTHVTQNSCPQLAFKEHTLSLQIKHSLSFCVST